MKKIVIKFFMTHIWPWIKAEILGKILVFAIEVFQKGLETLKNWIFEILERRSSSHSDHAENKAKESEQSANNSKTEAEAERFKSEARIWREVADNYKKDISFYQEKIDILTKHVSELTRKEITRADIKLEEKSGEFSVQIGDNTPELIPPPALEKKVS